MDNNSNSAIKNSAVVQMARTLGLRETITITVGTVVGVGLFTVGANSVGILGDKIIFATFVAFLISLYPALMYAEMGSAIPYSGGTFRFAVEGLGKSWGMLAGWNFVISLVAVAAGEALAFANYVKILLEAIGLSMVFDERIVAGILILFFITINFRGIELAAKWQNGFVFFLWGTALVWFITVLPNVNFTHFMPHATGISADWQTFIMATALVWWCFAGFETAVAMGEEIKFPQVNIPRAMFLTPFIVFAVTSIFQWFLLGIVPSTELGMIATSMAPYAEGMKAAGLVGFPLILLCAGIAFGGDMSTLNPSVAAPARYLFSMSREGVLPPFFGKLHPVHKTPYVAVIVLGAIMVFLVATGSIIYIASLSLFADLFYYIIGFMAFLGLRVKRKDIDRPYTAPAGAIGASLSILVYLVMATQLPTDGIITGIVWCAIGLAFYFGWSRTTTGKEALHKRTVEKLDEVMPALPNQYEQGVLDKEFNVWRNIVAAAFIIAISLYVIPFFMNIG